MHAPCPRLLSALSVLASLLLTPLLSRAQGGNLKLGDVYFDLTAFAGATYSTNITSSTVDARSDLFLRTGIDASGRWTMSQYNDLTFGLGLEFRKYVNTPELDSNNTFLSITPDTRVQFSVLAGNFRFIISDSLSFSSDPTDSVAVDPSGSLQFNLLEYSRIENSARIAGEWQINPLWAAQVSYTRTDVIPLDDVFASAERTDHAIFASLDRVINSWLTGGVYGSYSWNEYATAYGNSSSGYSFGVQATAQLSDTVSTTARYGWRFTDFDTDGANIDTTDYHGTEYSFDVAHDASSLYSHRLTYSRSLSYGFVSNYTLADTASYSYTFRGFKRADINGSLTWQHGRDSGGPFNERYNRFILNIGTEYALSKKLTWSLAYDYSIKNSALPDRDYVRNDFTILLRYDF